MTQAPFGPMSADEFQKAVDAPYGMAAGMLRRYDPLWGRMNAEGDPIRWKVTLEKSVRMRATTYVEAVTEEQADLLAANIDDAKLNWNFAHEDDGGEVIDVVPA